MTKVFKPKVKPIPSTWNSPTPTARSVHAGLYTPIFRPGAGGAVASVGAITGTVDGVTTIPVFGPQPRTKSTI
jgi:hypothetical protein